MPVVTNQAMTAAGEEVSPAQASLPVWSQDDLDAYLQSWQALHKTERRARRLLPPRYVRTPQGILNINTAEHVILPDPPPDETETAEREAARLKKSRI